jgi:chromate transporter
VGRRRNRFLVSRHRRLVSRPSGPSTPLQPGETIRIPSQTLFMAFSQMALMGFGGVMPFAYRTLVEKRRWLPERDFSQYLAFSQMLPGPTICNMAILVGWRFNGLWGAVGAFAGILLAPMLLVIVLGLAYAGMASHPVVQHALAGMSAVAAGLVVATAVKMAMGLLKTERLPARIAVAVVFALLAFIGVGLLRWPLILVAAGVAPFAIASAWLQAKASGND